MEELLFKLAAFRFNQQQYILTENRSLNIKQLKESENSSMDTAIASQQDTHKFDAVEPETSNENLNTDEEDAIEISNIALFSQRRTLPARASKEICNLRSRLSAPMKPVSKKSKNSKAPSLAKIKKLYLNKKLTNFHPTHLETIFEKPELEEKVEEQQEEITAELIGSKKLRRFISLPDGLNTTKTVVKQRRARIKRVFGQQPRKARISMAEFKKRLNKYETDSDEYNSDMSMDDFPSTSLAAESETLASPDATTPNELSFEFAANEFVKTDEVGCLTFGETISRITNEVKTVISMDEEEEDEGIGK